MKFRLDNGPVLAAVLGLILLAWMMSGAVSRQPEAPPRPDHGQDGEELVTVQVRHQQASLRERAVSMQGQTSPGRKASLRAEIDGSVVELSARKGSDLQAGDLIARIDVGDLPLQRARAVALIRQRELEYQGAKSLRKNGHLSESRLAESAADMAGARADLARIDQLLDDAQIRAPFAGRLDQLPVELGDYLRAGDLVATVLDFSPWIVAGDVAEREAPRLHTAGAAEIQLADDRRYSGSIRYIAAEGDPRTRTFSIEVEVQAALATPISGMTAGVRMPYARVLAHLISPALLTLSNGGALGVRVVDAGERVRFYPVEMVEAGLDGIWVTGLPKAIDLITVGAGYVADGDPVRVITEPGAAVGVGGDQAT